MSKTPVDVVENGVSTGLFPGATWAYGTARTLIVGATGTFAGPDSRAVEVDTPYDLASLTKPMATSSVAFVLASQGALSSETYVSEVLPEWPDRGTTVAGLLLHNSGLPAYLDLTEVGNPDVWQAIRAVAAPGLVPGPTVYSCLGFIVLQRILERVGGAGLDTLFENLVAEPLSLTSTRFRPELRSDITVPPTTQIEPWRARMMDGKEGLLQGIVHDPLAFLLGGVSGNAGLFGTAQDLGLIAQAVLTGSGPFDHQDWSAWLEPRGDRAMGWDVPTPGATSAGTTMSSRSVGHTGFTGTSLWIDREVGVFAVLLTNAVYLSPDRLALRLIRSEFADSVLAEAL
ncbi:MAG: beta-lactamase family protein [Armatimonadetes bacterium]|nr:beta-lactamase family protein [Armatimonadota bacterium]